MLYSRDWHNTVNQLCFNKKILKQRSCTPMSAAPMGLGKPHHSYLGMRKLRPRERKQLSQTAPGQTPGLSAPQAGSPSPFSVLLPQPPPQGLAASPGPGKPGWLQAVSGSSRDVPAAPVAPGSVAARGVALRGPWTPHRCVPCMELSWGPCVEARLPQAPPHTLSVALP